MVDMKISLKNLARTLNLKSLMASSNGDFVITKKQVLLSKNLLQFMNLNFISPQVRKTVFELF